MGDTLGTHGEVPEHFFEELFGATRDGERCPPVNAQTGDRVLMHGLNRTELNGRYAVVLDPAPVAGRYHLRLEDDQQEIRARGKNFTRVLATPMEVVDLVTEEAAVDTSTLLHGNCCTCLTEKACLAAIPCGHLALCKACGPRASGSCPICRRRDFSLLRIYTPGGTREEELEKALDLCRAAQKRASDLEAQAETPSKRAKQGAKRQKEKAATVGSWVRMPTLSAHQLEMVLSPADIQYSQQYGEIVAMADANTCWARFRAVDEKIFVEEGKRRPGNEYKDVLIPLGMPFQAVHSSITARDMYCVLPSMRRGRQRKLRAEHRAKDKHT